MKSWKKSCVRSILILLILALPLLTGCGTTRIDVHDEHNTTVWTNWSLLEGTHTCAILRDNNATVTILHGQDDDAPLEPLHHGDYWLDFPHQPETFFFNKREDAVIYADKFCHGRLL